MKKILIFVVFGAIGGLLSSCSTSPSKKELTPEERAQLHLEIGTGHLLNGDAVGALQQAEIAQRYEAGIPDIYHLRALAHTLRKDLDSAIAAAEKASELGPDRPEIQNTLGKLYLDAGKLALAEKSLQKAASNVLYRDAYKARTALGMLELKRGSIDRAEKEFSRAIDENAQLACRAYLERGKIRLKSNRAIGAVSDLEHASTRLCGTVAEAELMLGDAYLKAEQLERARKKFVSIQQLYPDTPEAKAALEKLRSLP